MNTADEDVWKYLKMLTLIEVEEIDKIVEAHMENPWERQWQKLLAFHVVEIIHSSSDAEIARKISDLLFWKSDKLELLKNLKKDEIESFYSELWGFEYEWENLFETIVKSGLAKSNSEARQAIQSGAIHIQEEKIENFQYDISNKFLNNDVLLLRKGKKNYRIIKK
jgi:tyrosyl-tRNA synthetase